MEYIYQHLYEYDVTKYHFLSGVKICVNSKVSFS